MHFFAISLNFFASLVFIISTISLFEELKFPILETSQFFNFLSQHRLEKFQSIYLQLNMVKNFIVIYFYSFFIKFFKQFTVKTFFQILEVLSYCILFSFKNSSFTANCSSTGTSLTKLTREINEPFRCLIKKIFHKIFIVFC